MAEPFLEIAGATVVRGDRKLVDDLSLSVREGEHLAILGPNGSGKSTLVNLILQQVRPLYGGKVALWGQAQWDLFELRRQLGFVSPALQGDLAGEEALEVMEAVVSGFFASRGLWHAQKVTDEMRARAHEALVRASADHLIGRRMNTLSTGEARRVLIARALVHRPRALLLDEACAGLDPAARRAFLQDLRGVIGPQTTLIVVTHHIDEILPEIGRVVMMKQGRLIADGPKSEQLTDENLSALFGLSARVSHRDGWYGAIYG
ncbi:ATP-binding cassette domain-containing protein [uncultured Brevundimonas sp.]|uniref:ABC transporter ATP-binding protein n=1 Tax=uncultured Brevundimonas sp. TaxID=213418 RepID=UPI002619F507|nr:ATP-binding cassette domain-containing protein [uncultured Brevundimonas sp.]